LADTAFQGASVVNRLNLALDVAHTRVWDFLNGKRRINRTTIKALGYDPTSYYRR
jgi:hypothetical protein